MTLPEALDPTIVAHLDRRTQGIRAAPLVYEFLAPASRPSSLPLKLGRSATTSRPAEAARANE